MRNNEHHDKTLLLAVLGLLVVGIVMVYSSSSVVALRSYNDPAYFMKRQIVWALLGLAVMTLAMYTDHRALADQRAVVVMLVVMLVLMTATLIPGIGKMINGARRWIGLGGLTFQPSELAKFVVVVYLSYAIAKKGERIRDLASGLVPLLVVTGLFTGLAVLQPDFGAAVTMGTVAFTLLFAGGANLLHLAGLAVLAIPAAILAVVRSPYRLQRIFSYLDPWADPQGSGHQIIQSFLAFGSGGLIGRGLGEGRQKLLFLPERHSDFIYAVIGEELGFIGAFAVLSLFFLVLWRGILIARTAEDRFSRLLALGITLIICLQGFVNMAVVTGLLPTKGIALPLVSYGGSSLVVTLGAVGVLLNISKEVRA